MAYRKLTIEDMQDLAQRLGGKCLSVTYCNSMGKLTWECAHGHQWQAKPGHVKNGHWCPYCAGNRRGTIDEMVILSASRGGRCHSKKYVNAHTKLEFECSEGHRWAATPYSVKTRNSWCPECARKRNTERQRFSLEDIKSYAKSKGAFVWLKNIKTELKRSNGNVLRATAGGHLPSVWLWLEIGVPTVAP